VGAAGARAVRGNLVRVSSPHFSAHGAPPPANGWPAARGGAADPPRGSQRAPRPALTGEAGAAAVESSGRGGTPAGTCADDARRINACYNSPLGPPRNQHCMPVLASASSLAARDALCLVRVGGARQVGCVVLLSVLRRNGWVQSFQHFAYAELACRRAESECSRRLASAVRVWCV
jgi:hypothetical protein